ncbi:hypothetical protein PMI06_006592 [Burkholderia sp. BT03]|nr:hypothetical protein PMI06_006592 [Burkholderia sp. BT03]SKC93959.1 hypothetical protein SAMN06266956_5835 [Paraburkholderia hospita]
MIFLFLPSAREDPPPSTRPARRVGAFIPFVAAQASRRSSTPTRATRMHLLFPESVSKGVHRCGNDLLATLVGSSNQLPLQGVGTLPTGDSHNGATQNE